MIQCHLTVLRRILTRKQPDRRFPQFNAVPLVVFGMVFWGGLYLWLLSTIK